MKILGITTSSNIASVAVCNNNETIHELNINNTKTHSETLIPLISDLLLKSKLDLSDIDLIACDVGPRFFYWN